MLALISLVLLVLRVLHPRLNVKERGEGSFELHLGDAKRLLSQTGTTDDHLQYNVTFSLQHRQRNNDNDI